MVMILSAWPVAGQVSSGHTNIVVHLTNLRNNNGDAAVALYNSADGFPDDSTKVFMSGIGDIEASESFVAFRHVPYGLYAIAVLHDENRNGRMDKGLFGIPKEGYGFSNNARGFMGAPDFEAAKFYVGQDSVVVLIRIRY